MNYEPSYKILNMSPLDDKNTILYQYVYRYKLPKSFFALINGEVYNIYDLLKHQYDQEFKPLDSLMTFYESTIEINQDYKQWVIKGDYKKIKNMTNLIEYDVNDVLEAYGDNKMVKKYFKNHKVIYYEGDLEELFKIFNKKKDVKILDLLLTQQDYEFGLYQLQITPDQDLLNLLNQFKYKYKSLRNIKYDSKSFINAYHEWLVDTHRQYLQDLKMATLIHDIQSLLINNDLLVSSRGPSVEGSTLVSLTGPRTYDHLVKIYNPFLLNRKNIPIDIYDGLDLFNDAILSINTPFLIYKDYKGQLYYKIFNHIFTKGSSMPDTTLIEDNAIHYTLINQGKTHDVVYHLNDNALQISYTHYKNTPNDKTIFPTLDIGNVIDYNMEGHFNIYDIELDEASLLSFILNDDLINKILFVDDHAKFIFKKSISLKYIPLGTTTVINIDLIQSFYNDDKVVDTVNGRVKLLKKKRKYVPYIQVKFKNVYHDKSFVNLITSLIAPYQGTTELNQLLLNLDYKKEKDMDENLRKLKDLAPDAFVEGYANFCDVKKRPLPIEQEDIDDYIKNKVKEYGLKGEEANHYKKHAVLTFPVNGEDLHLVCDHPEDPYPYLKSTLNSKKLSALNKEQYEELPCCKKIAPKATKTIKKEATHLTSASVIFNPGSTGEIDANIKYLLQNYNTDKNNFIRLGIVAPGDPYSFIHCLGLATDDPQYINTKNKDKYVDMILDQLKKISVVAKQELYDMSVNEIALSLDKIDFFDPDLYYRLLEEYYNVNIYVFNTSLVLPRFKEFHTRALRQKPSVLIYKNDNQCELIINVLSETHKMLIFDHTMSKYCHQFLQSVLNTYTFVNNQNIKTHHNLYYHANHLTFIPNIVSQYIDENGKMAGLTIKVNNKLMSILTLPSQPENLPIDLTIHRIDVKDVFNIMTQKHTGVTVSNNLITGLWYRIYDVEFGEYIPIKPTDMEINKIGPNHVYMEKEKTTGQYTFMKKILSRLLQLIQWLFLVAVYKYNIVNDVDEFFDQYVSYSNKDSFIYNDLINIPRRLPVYEKFTSYFDYIKEYSSPLVKNNKLVMYNQDFYNKIKIYLTNFHLSDNDIPLFIINYYQYVNDFKQLPNTLIFLNQENMNAWQETHKQIYYEVLPETIYPYIYKTLNGKIFIIQNVKNNYLQTALSVCDYWHNHQINIGPHGTTGDFNEDMNIYKINDLQQLELVQIGKYHILDYNYRSGRVGSSKYAAMLPLL